MQIEFGNGRLLLHGIDWVFKVWHDRFYDLSISIHGKIQGRESSQNQYTVACKRYFKLAPADAKIDDV